MSRFSSYPYGTRRNAPGTSDAITYLDEQPVYGDTSAPAAPSPGRAPAAPMLPGTPPQRPDYYALQNARSDRQRAQTIAGNAIQARSNATFAAAAPLPGLPAPSGSSVAPLPSRSAPTPTMGGTAAPGRIQFTEQQAREMLHNMGAARPGMTIDELRPEWTQTLGKYGIDAAGAGALWDRWQQQGTLGKADFVNGQTTTPAQPQLIAPPNAQAGTGGIAVLPGGQTVVTNPNGRQIGGPIAQGAPLPSTTNPTFGPEQGYTPIQNGGAYAQSPAPAPAAPQQPLPYTPPANARGSLASQQPQELRMGNGSPRPAVSVSTSLPGVPPQAQTAAATSAPPASPLPATAQQPPSQTYSGALPGVDPTAAAARQAYIGRQNDRADQLSGGYYSNRENTGNLVDAQAENLRAGAADAKDLRRQNTSLQGQNTQMQNQVTRMQNSQTLAGARGATLTEAKQKAYYESRIDSAREDVHVASAAYSGMPTPANLQALKDAQVVLRNAHGDYQNHLEGKDSAPTAQGAPTTQPTAAPGQPNSFTDPNLPRPGATQRPGGTALKLPSGVVIYRQNDGQYLDENGGPVVVR